MPGAPMADWRRIRHAAQAEAHRFSAALENPRAAQLSLLQGILAANAGCEFGVPVMEHDMIGEQLADQLRHRLAIEWGADFVIAHRPAGCIGELAVLDVELRIGEDAQ